MFSMARRVPLSVGGIATVQDSEGVWGRSYGISACENPSF